jgi:exosortase/archaeosortase family protein
VVLPLLALAGYWLILIYYLGAQWSLFEQYNYGWAVPFLCAYLLWRKAESRKQKAEKGNAETLKTDMLKAEAVRSPASFSFSAFQLFSFFALALLYAPTRFLHEANPVWRLTSWLWALEVLGLTLLTILLVRGPWSVVRSPVVPSSLPSSRPSFQLSAFSFSAFVFPICFFLVAVPWPSGLENPVTQSLMRLNVTTTIELLGLFNIPAIQHGNVIEVGTGVVGIEEACSGIRSFQATLMISLFLGEIYRLTIRRRLLLVASGFILSFVFNVGRTSLLTGIAAAKGVGAIDSWHDPVGIAILVACFFSLWLFARALQKAESRKQKAETGTARSPDCETTGLDVAGQRPEVRGPSTLNSQPSTATSPHPSTGPVVPWSRGLVVPCSLVAWLLFVEAGTQLWYRWHERRAFGAANWSVNLDVADPAVTRIELPQSIRGQFRADQSLHGGWQDSSGNAWQLYYFRWLPAHSLKGRVAIGLAKTHGPEKCLPAAGMSLRSYLGIITVPVAGMELAMQQYVFGAEGKSIHVFYGIYEDPAGSTVLANRRQNTVSRIKAALAGSRNYGQRFLEVAVFGYERSEDARAALVRELEKVIKVEG